MLFADVTFSDPGIAVIGALLAVLTGVIKVLYSRLVEATDREAARVAALYEAQLKIKDAAFEAQLKVKDAAFEAQLKVKEDAMKSFREMTAESLSVVERLANEKLVAAGKKPVRAVAPVVPEHHSPTTPDQEVTAEIATARAKLVACTLALGLPPRAKGEDDPPPNPVMTVVDKVVELEVRVETLEEVVAHKDETIVKLETEAAAPGGEPVPLAPHALKLRAAADGAAKKE